MPTAPRPTLQALGRAVTTVCSPSTKLPLPATLAGRGSVAALLLAAAGQGQGQARPRRSMAKPQHAPLWPPTPFQPAELAAGRQQSMLCVRLCVGEEDGPRVAIREKAGGFVKTSDSCEQCRKGSMCSYLICVFRRDPDARFQFLFSGFYRFECSTLKIRSNL